MKNKDNKAFYIIVSAMVIVAVFIFVFALIFVSNKSSIYITLYNPINNSEEVIKTKAGKDINDKLKVEEIDGYEFIGWFYDDNFTIKVEEGTLFSSSHILKAGYSKIIKANEINVDITSNIKSFTIKTEEGQYITKSLLNQILEINPTYLNLKDCDFENNTIHIGAFLNQTNLKEIILPKNIETISQSAFKNCYNLESIKFGDNIKIIEKEAFYNCKKIKDITLVESIENLGERVFEGCDNLKILNLNKNLININSKAFLGIELEEITLSSENENYIIENNVLYTKDFKQLIYVPNYFRGELILNENTDSIRDYAAINSQVKKIKFIKEIQNIGVESFKNCKQLEEVNLKNSSSYIINESAFENCIQLKEINFSIGLKRLEQASFKGCVKLEKVIFNISTSSDIENIQSIENSVFKNCKSLKEIIIPDCVYSLEKEVFSGCLALEKVTLSAQIDTLKEKLFYENKNLKTVISNGEIKFIDNYAFAECESLEVFNSFDSIQTIGVAGFKGCDSLIEVNLQSLVSLGIEAFYDCEKLEKINLSVIEELKEKSFACCSNLKEISLPQTINNVNETTFEECKLLEKISCEENSFYCSIDGVLYSLNKENIICYPQNKKDIDFTIDKETINILDKGIYLNPYIKNIYVNTENTVFSSIDGVLYSKNEEKLLRYPSGRGIVNVEILTGVKTIESYAFAYNDTIVKLTIPTSVETIKQSALYKMNSLQEVILPFVGMSRNKNKYLGYIFGANTYIANNNYVPSSLKKISITSDIVLDKYSFYDLVNVEYIELNDQITIIKEYAFYGAVKLKEIRFNGKISNIKNYSFVDLENLKTIFIGFNLDIKIDINAFINLNNVIEVYVDNNNQTVYQKDRSTYIERFSCVFAKAKIWRWYF